MGNDDANVIAGKIIEIIEDEFRVAMTDKQIDYIYQRVFDALDPYIDAEK